MKSHRQSRFAAFYLGVSIATDLSGDSALLIKRCLPEVTIKFTGMSANTKKPTLN